MHVLVALLSSQQALLNLQQVQWEPKIRSFEKLFVLYISILFIPVNTGK